MLNYKSLEVYSVSMELVKSIYLITKNYPPEERYGLTSQTRRAAVSIPTNIAEGLGRQYKRDTLQFLFVSRGSLFEVDTLLNVAVVTEILATAKYEELKPMLERTLKLLNGFIRSMESRTDLK